MIYSLLCYAAATLLHAQKRRRNRPAPMEPKKMAILIAIHTILNVTVVIGNRP